MKDKMIYALLIVCLIVMGMALVYGAIQLGVFELAVLDKDGNILNNTDITDDVIGWQDEKDIDRLLNAVANLDKDGTLSNKILL